MRNRDRTTKAGAVLGSTALAGLLWIGCVSATQNPGASRARAISPSPTSVAPAETGTARSGTLSPVVGHNRPKTMFLGPLGPAPGYTTTATEVAAGEATRLVTVDAAGTLLLVPEAAVPEGSDVAQNITLPATAAGAGGVIAGTITSLGVAGPAVVASGSPLGSGVAGTTSPGVAGPASTVASSVSNGVRNGAAAAGVATTAGATGIAGARLAPGVAGPPSAASISGTSVITDRQPADALGAVQIASGVAGTITAPGVAGPVSSRAVTGPNGSVATLAPISGPRTDLSGGVVDQAISAQSGAARIANAPTEQPSAFRRILRRVFSGGEVRAPGEATGRLAIIGTGSSIRVERRSQ
ncbi:MAG TPA: hypothetical protein VMT00_09585 [Thermoanaerobaculia bacterium]|nr:hypothetical protein [Thermoanaerobaculia bacterium]